MTTWRRIDDQVKGIYSRTGIPSGRGMFACDSLVAEGRSNLCWSWSVQVLRICFSVEHRICLHCHCGRAFNLNPGTFDGLVTVMTLGIPRCTPVLLSMGPINDIRTTDHTTRQVLPNGTPGCLRRKHVQKPQPAGPFPLRCGEFAQRLRGYAESLLYLSGSCI